MPLMPCRAFVVLCALLMGCAAHQSPPQPGQPRRAEPPRRALGRITIAPVADACQGSSCFTFAVESDDLAKSASGRVVVSEPTGTLRGTVLSFSGGAGTSLSGDAPTMTA